MQKQKLQKPKKSCGNKNGSKADVAKVKADAKVETAKAKVADKASGEYYNGKKVYTGPKGGKYYINKNGNKTYIDQK